MLKCPGSPVDLFLESGGPASGARRAVRKAKSIRVQLLHLIMAMAIPVATLEVYSIYTEYRSAEEQAERSIINLAEATSFTVGRYLREAQSVTTAFAGWLSSQGARDTRFCNALTAENDIIAQFHNLPWWTLRVA